jgi:hypothetical protein
VTIIATAKVPRHLSLRLADGPTAEYRLLPLRDRIRVLVDQGLTVVEVADLLHVTAYEAFHAGAIIRTGADVKAIAATLPPPSDVDRARTAVLGAQLATMTIEDIADRWALHPTTAARVRDLYAGSTR